MHCGFGRWSWWEVGFVSDVQGIRAVTFEVVISRLSFFRE